MNPPIILSEREASEARSVVSELELALSSESMFRRLIDGLPPKVVDGYRKAINTHKAELNATISAYDAAKSGNCAELMRRAGSNLGVALVIARISRSLTQKELARKLGLKEQQIQRYEAERYRAISLANFQKVAAVLGVQCETRISKWIGGEWGVTRGVSAPEVKKVLRHAKVNAWFKGDGPASCVEYGSSYLQQYITDHMLKYGSPSLLRTGLNVDEEIDDLSLLAWKARITKRAENIILAGHISYSPIDITWLAQLVKLSRLDDGPVQAQEFLKEHGIVLVIEPQIEGMKVDGAAFLLNGVPVIGMTIRRDTIDNFWFTLLHEVGHVVLHYHTGLSTGFYDDTEKSDVDELEQEANDFASNIIVPDEKWIRSPARIAKTRSVIEKFSIENGIHPAILFGRIQKEREDYRIFSSFVGRGQVRNQFMISK